MIMAEIARLNHPSDGIQLDFVERVHTPKNLMRLAIDVHLGGLSLSQTVLLLECLGVDRARSTIHYWVKQADLEPADGCSPNQVALDETVIKVNGERFWLFAAVDPSSNRILHIRLFPTRTTAITKIFLSELEEKHEIEDARFLVDGAPWLQAALYERGLVFRHVTFGDRNPGERIFQEIKRRTRQFYNSFGNANPETAENWLQALAWRLNELL